MSLFSAYPVKGGDNCPHPIITMTVSLTRHLVAFAQPAWSGANIADLVRQLELHIGYVYGSNGPANEPSNYVAKYVPGGRLPHLWIRPLNETLLKGIPPTDLSHVHELSDNEKAMRQYSTLDLCWYDVFTLIVNASEGQEERAREIQKLANSINGKGPGLALRTVTLGADFSIVFEQQGREWLSKFRLGCGQRGAVLVRPDQHILFVLTKSTTQGRWWMPCVPMLDMR